MKRSRWFEARSGTVPLHGRHQQRAGLGKVRLDVASDVCMGRSGRLRPQIAVPHMGDVALR